MTGSCRAGHLTLLWLQVDAAASLWRLRPAGQQVAPEETALRPDGSEVAGQEGLLQVGVGGQAPPLPTSLSS